MTHFMKMAMLNYSLKLEPKPVLDDIDNELKELESENATSK